MAKVEYKVLSHVERKMRSNELEKSKGSYIDLETSVQEVGYELDKTGKAVRISKLKTVKVADKFKDFNVNDFSLENLQASGAIANLKFSSLAGDVDVSTANIEKLMDHVDAQVAQVEVE